MARPRQHQGLRSWIPTASAYDHIAAAGLRLSLCSLSNAGRRRLLHEVAALGGLKQMNSVLGTTVRWRKRFTAERAPQALHSGLTHGGNHRLDGSTSVRPIIRHYARWRQHLTYTFVRMPSGATSCKWKPIGGRMGIIEPMRLMRTTTSSIDATSRRTRARLL
jgi:hypothetical protein